MRPILLEFPHWTFAGGLLDPALYQDVREGIEDKVATYHAEMYGKTYEVKKKSCVFTSKDAIEQAGQVDAKARGFDYGKLPVYPWEEAPQSILDIKKRLEKTFGYNSDYVLVHLYRDPKDYIGWHNDKEALKSEIYSVSLGCPRKFQFKPIERVNDEADCEWIMRSGDVFHMHGPRDEEYSCQELYKHRVPQMTIGELKNILEENDVEVTGRASFKNYMELAAKNDIDLSRINLTFRQYE